MGRHSEHRLDPSQPDRMLADTQLAFDSVAGVYDGPRGNNALIQRMREQSWHLIGRHVPVGSRLLDIGCGTGTDALHFATLGYSVLATDWSPQMVARSAERAAAQGLAHRLQAKQVGGQELHQLGGEFDGAYSNFGPLNCVPDLSGLSRECARLLAPRGCMVFTIMGRVCPWELAYYLPRLKLKRALGPRLGVAR
jgi:ubiquinone/menaquinone biosynthesis C-methylase UbiE